MTQSLTKFAFLGLILISLFGQLLQAQPIKTMTQSVFNGAATGATIATANWMVQNDGSKLTLDDVSFGIGAGLLGGIGVGLIDVFQSSGDSDYAVKGVFNVSRNRTGLILLDTYYGAGAGLILSGAFTLMSDNKSWDNLREGIGVGAWFGFGFGLVDGLILSKQTSVPSNISLFDFKKAKVSQKSTVQWAIAKPMNGGISALSLRVNVK
jgi:hypothetical protein